MLALIEYNQYPYKKRLGYTHACTHRKDWEGNHLQAKERNRRRNKTC